MITIRTRIAVKINVNNKIAVEIKNEEDRIPAEQLPVTELLTGSGVER